MVGIVYVSLAFLFVLFLGGAAAAWLAQKGIRPLSSALARIKSLRPSMRIAFLALAGGTIVYGSVKSGGGNGGTNGVMGVIFPPGPLRILDFPAIELGEDELAAGFALQRVALGLAPGFDPSSNATIHAKWVARGAYEDIFPVTNSASAEWVFPFGTDVVTRLDVAASGYAIPRSARGFAGGEGRLLAPFMAPVSIAPESIWGELAASNAQSRLWHATTDEGGLLVTWQNALLERDAEKPISVQLELRPSGEFLYHYSIAPEFLSSLLELPYIGALNGGFGESLGDCVSGHAISDLAEAASTGAVSVVWQPLMPEDATIADRDLDGLDTAAEIFVHYTDPGLPDSDGDGLLDGEEIALGSDPLSVDTDDDGLADGSDPDPLVWAQYSDIDENGLYDSYEDYWFGASNHVESASIRDGTGFTYGFKMISGINPTNAPSSCECITTNVLYAWKLFDGFTAVVTNSDELVYERTFQINRTGTWQQFFLSSKPNEAGAWRLDGMAFEWEDSCGAEGEAQSSPFGDSLRLQLSSNNPTTLTVRLIGGPGRVRSMGPVYLVEYAPDVDLSSNCTVVQLAGGTEVNVFTNGTSAALHVSVDRSMRPCRAPLSDEELLMDGVRNIDETSNGTFRFEGDSSGGDILANTTGEYAMPTLYVPAPAMGASRPSRPLSTAVGSPQMILVLRPSVWYGEDYADFTLAYDWTQRVYAVEHPYPLDSACLWQNWIRNETGATVCNCVPGVSSGLGGEKPTYLTETISVDGNVATGTISVGGTIVWTGSQRHIVSGHDAVSVKRLDDIDECSECDGGCGDVQIGEFEGASLGSFKFRIPIGLARKGQISGFVYMEAQGPAAVSPQSFSTLLRADALTEDVFLGGERVVSSSAPGGRTVRITPITSGARLAVEDTASHALDHVWEISNTTNGTSEILVRKLGPGNDTIEQMVFSYDEGVWSRYDISMGSTETVSSVSYLDEGGPIIETRIVTDESGSVLSRVVTESRLVGDLSCAVLRETRRLERTGKGEIERCAEYWCDPSHHGRHGKLKLMTGDGMAWEYHDWNDAGDEILRVEGMDAAGMPAVMPRLLGGALADCGYVVSAMATVFSYTPDTLDDSDPEDASLPREVTRLVIEDGAAKTIGREWMRYTRLTVQGYDAIKAEKWRAYSPSAQMNDPMNAYSYVIKFDRQGQGTPIAMRGMEVESLDEDGMLVEHVFTIDGNVLSDERTSSFLSEADPISKVTEYDALSGLVLREATYVSDVDDPIEEEIYLYDSDGRLVSTSYQDGTSTTNAYNNGSLEWRMARNGRTVLMGGTADGRFSAVADVWLSEVSTNGFKVTQRFKDALGRKTNEVVYVTADIDDVPIPDASDGRRIVQSTVSYPYGGDDFIVETDIRGLETDTIRTYDGAIVRVETLRGAGANSSIRMRTVTSSVANGDSKTRSEWGGRWTERIVHTEYDDEGRKSVFDISRMSGLGTVTNMVTKSDFLGRVVERATPAGVVSNSYFGSSSRLSSVSKTYPDGLSIETLPIYGIHGEIEGSQTMGLSSLRRTTYEESSNALWRVTRDMRCAGSETNLLSETRERLTGLSASLLSEEEICASSGGRKRIVSRMVSPGMTVTETFCESAPDMVVTSLYGLAVSETSPFAERKKSYDALGRLHFETENVDGCERPFMRLEHSPAGDITEIATFTNLQSNVSAYFGYDLLGRRIASTNTLGHATQRVMDACGNILLESGATCPAKYSYDSQGRLTSISTTRNGFSWDRSLIGYERTFGREALRQYANGSSRAISYTSDGRIDTLTMPSGDEIVFLYDDARRLAGIDADGEPEVETRFEYDVFGSMALASNGVSVVEWVNTPSGFATNEIVRMQRGNSQLFREYDSCGRLSARMRQGGGVDSFAYDGSGLLSVVSNEMFSVTYLYGDGGRDLGRVTVLSNGTVFTETKTRDPFMDHCVTSVSNSVLGAQSSSLEYEWDVMGNIVSRGEDTFSYNERGEVSSAEVDGCMSRYWYDEAGNRLFWTREDDLTAVTNSYIANCVNAYACIDEDSLSYDGSGCLTHWGDFDFAYDSQCRLTEVSTNGAVALSIGYDALGRRATIAYVDRTHSFLYDGNLPICEWVDHSGGGHDVIEYHWGRDVSGSLDRLGGIGALLSVCVNGDILVPEYDAMGNVTGYRDSGGVKVAGFAYDAFGRCIGETGPMSCLVRMRFQTQYFEPLSGLCLYRYREYSPALGRFLTRDPAGERGGLNLYAPCGNNFVSRSDALGLYGNIVDRATFWSAFTAMYCAMEYAGLHITAALLANSLKDNPISPFVFREGSLMVSYITKSDAYVSEIEKAITKILENPQRQAPGEYKNFGTIRFALPAGAVRMDKKLAYGLLGCALEQHNQSITPYEWIGIWDKFNSLVEANLDDAPYICAANVAGIPDADLALALHDVTLKLKPDVCSIGGKTKRLRRLDVCILDKYDFDYHTLKDAIVKADEWPVTIVNNMAFLAQECGVIVPFDVKVLFEEKRARGRSQ